MSRHEDMVRIRHMLDYARETVALVQGRSRRDLDSDRVLSLVSCLRGSPNKSPGYGSLGKACHPESLDCHSERSEESQDKLREGSQTSRHSSPEPVLSSF
jgi:hypothetical protein